MGSPIKFKTKKKFRVVNRCIMCEKLIPMNKAICNSCNSKRLRAIRSRRG